MNFVFRPFPLPVHCFGLSETLVTQSFRFSGLILYVSHLLPISLYPFLFCVPVCLGLLYAGDKLVEVNGVSVEGLDPEQVIHILVTVSSLPSSRLSKMQDRTRPVQLMVCAL